MKTNTRPAVIRTHEGAPAKRISPILQLRRSVMATLLWENQAYEDGVEIAKRIQDLVAQCQPEMVSSLAIEARNAMKLRHVPLLLAREMARIPTHKALVADVLHAVIQRPDELTEFLSIYWSGGRQPLSAQVKKGLALAFNKFDGYALAKYNQQNAVKLRDVLFLCHAKPKDEEQAALWKLLVDNKLATPDTWEVALSAAGSDTAKKLDCWLRLMRERKLGALALLRNLRNMQEVGVPDAVIRNALAEVKADRVLPFRFIAAARYAPKMEDVLESCMMKCVQGLDKLPGVTTLLVDVSGSMNAAISAKSDLTRLDAACGLAILLREVCEHVEISTFSYENVTIPPRRGFALRDSIVSSQPHGATHLGEAVNAANAKPTDRLIVLTDEQSAQPVPDPRHPKAYMINVASAKNGVGYGKWTHIDGWSEAVVQYIKAYESAQ